MTTDRLIAPSFLFRFSVPCLPMDSIWSKDELELPDTHRIPNFGELDGRAAFADVRAGWSTEGIGFSMRIVGKKQSVWCRDSRIDESDGVSILIDARDTHNIHRASRFCHRFVFLPQGSGTKSLSPVATMVNIARSKENPKAINDSVLKIRSEKRIDGYILRGAIPGSAITGWDPVEHIRLGFNYVLSDRELGCQIYSGDVEMPVTSDPSLWGSLELAD